MFLEFSSGFPMVFLWFSNGFPMVFLMFLFQALPAEDISAKDSYDVQYFRGGGVFRIDVPVMSLGLKRHGFSVFGYKKP